MNLAALAESGDPEIGTLVSGSGLSQSSGPELIDFQRESKETLDMYWAEPNKATYANDCLLARRLLERGAYRLCSFGKFTSGLRQSAIAAPAITCSNRTMDVSGVGAGPQAADLSAALRAVVHTATCVAQHSPTAICLCRVFRRFPNRK